MGPLWYEILELVIGAMTRLIGETIMSEVNFSRVSEHTRLMPRTKGAVQGEPDEV
jgi:hypothetical protein